MRRAHSVQEKGPSQAIALKNVARRSSHHDALVVVLAVLVNAGSSLIFLLLSFYFLRKLLFEKSHELFVEMCCILVRNRLHRNARDTAYHWRPP